MKMGANGPNHRRHVGAGIAFLAIFAFCGLVRAEDVITADLMVTPSLTAKPGDVLTFQADIIYNPAFSEPAGTRMRICVIRSNFSWVSDKLDIEYPGMGSVHVNFKNGYTIPPKTKSGKVLRFLLVYGPWWRLSENVSVKVKKFYIKKMLVKKQF